ncbi:hypothetical protein GQX73_g5725 [Xylaria multiplex]|uniref:NACHT domain-containing protein n=1 Tax=Xylaria multiplex TaxID=323545 RepID=A0A7C8IQP6_9PEZI|nr:hypothetical protein GQX73_g5725 [Xylaria multiplex]
MDETRQDNDLKPDAELTFDTARHAVPVRVLDPSPSLEEQQSAVQQWLQPTDYLSPGSEFVKHLHSHVPGTCSWLHESPSFKTWTTPGQTNCLAIRGVAGSGKSVLAASIIHQLQKAEPNVPVLFFFFRQIVERNHSARYLIRDFASQLLPHSQSLVSSLRALSKSCDVEGNEQNGVWDALVDSINRLEKVYLVVDALDEMDEHDFAVIDHLVKLGNHPGSTTKLLVTSRPLPRIEETLRALRVPHVRLDPSLTHPDVARYVVISMSTLDPMMSPEKKDIVRQAVCDRAQGLFLHARLMIDALVEGLQAGRITEDTLPDSLDRLPRNLKDVYEEILKEHSRRSGVSAEQQARILMCVTQARRPLRLIELGSLVAVMRESEDLNEGKALVRASCGTLLEILEDETVSVIHHSFTEFLYDETRTSRPRSFSVIDGVAAHAMLAVLSLRYLNGCPLLDTARDDLGEHVQGPVASRNPIRNTVPWRSVTSPSDECAPYDYKYDDPTWLRNELQRRQQVIQDLTLVYHLLRYAITNLSHHIEKAGHGHPDVVSAIDTFLVPGKPSFGVWVYSNWKSYLCSTLSPVHVASFENWPAIVEHLSVKYPMLIDAPDGSGRSPISYAAEKGHTRIVNFLLKKGALPQSDDRVGLTPMHYAASNGHTDVARLLIEVGVSPLVKKTKNTPYNKYEQFDSDRGETALQYAFTGCHSTLISLFLPFVPTSEIDRCLHWARHAEHLEMVLKTGKANVDSFCGGKTKLFKAGKDHDLEVIQLLLRYGADPNRRCGMEPWYDARDDEVTQTFHCPTGPTVIHALAGYDDIDRLSGDLSIERARKCLETLVSYGAQIDARADEATGWSKDSDLTPLHYAVRKRDVVCSFDYWFSDDTPEIMARLLLEAGANPNARSKLGRNCIHFANPELPGLTDVLISGGADINATDVNGLSPLLAMISPQGRHDMKPDIPAFERLIRSGADIGLSSNMGNTILHMVMMNLGKFKEKDIPFLLTLITSRGDFNKRNNKGLVPLLEYKIPGRNDYEESNQDDEKILQAMIQKGMDINASDDVGETILWKIAQSRGADFETIQQFIRLGANPGLRNADGSTFLHFAVRKRFDIKWIQYLVASGADPTLQDDEGRTLIHMAIEAYINQPHDGIHLIYALAELGVSPMKPMIGGQTILHIASSYGKTFPGRENWIDMILGEPIFGLSNPNIADISGATPLHYAAAYTSEFTTGKLLQLGADPASLTAEGLSPLHIACIARRPNIVGVLLSSYKERGLLGQFVNQAHSNGTGRSPLHYACRSSCLESVMYLLSHGADPSHRDGDSRTSLHALAEFPLERKLGKEASPVKKRDLTTVGGELRPTELYWPPSRVQDRTASILELLVVAGADLEARAVERDGSSVTAMDIALQNDSKILVKELLRRGVKIPLGAEIHLPNDEDVRNTAQALLSIADSRKLTEAIKEILSEGNYEAIEEFARLGGDMKTPDSSRRTGLHVLVAGGYSDLLERSFKNDISQFEILVETEKPTGLPGLRSLLVDACAWQTALLTAVGSKSPYGFWKKATIGVLLENGSNPNDREIKADGSGQSCLEISNDVRVTQLLLKYGADVSRSPGALHNAITSGMDLDMVRCLLEAGADPNGLLYDDGRHVLQACIEEKGVISSLLKSDNLDLQKRGKGGRTALISACVPTLLKSQLTRRSDNKRSAPHAEAAIALLKGGAVADILDDTGRNALHWLCTFKDEPFGSTHLDLLDAFLAAQSSLIHVADKAGNNPLHLALQSDQTAVVQLLIKHGADPAKPDAEGNIALHHYARHMFGEKVMATDAARMFKSLLDRGLEINARNHHGETPLQVYIAMEWDDKKYQCERNYKCKQDDVLGRDNDEIWDIFKDANADWKTTDNQGVGLLHSVASRKVVSTLAQWERYQAKDIESTFKKLMEDMSLNPRQEDAQLRTPIDLAVVRGHDGILALFSDKKKHSDDTQGRFGRWKRMRTDA